MAKINRNLARKKRHKRVRKKVYGTTEKPRLNVFRSLNNIYAQIIDDNEGHTLVSASTVEPDLKEYKGKPDIEASKKVGEKLAKKAQEKGVEEVIFDRGGYKFHGRVKALADSARENGLKF
ncbi:50S ribosomal protein L18 [Natranaerofaba carboxydovora]|uniref:50S ribosomal protein L18 n=1 Tax=Natranaerofaba carboxydovora TaxID=2742683 RepID=UPI001F133223|nr:50S ribosomal protein L18 [Natranaerofaba carboxydovora]UMZ75409.1 50S ribosomal protein L18 [Natranaerofaba carboxydovora]